MKMLPYQRDKFGALVWNNHHDDSHENDHADFACLRRDWREIPDNCDSCHHNEERIEEVHVAGNRVIGKALLLYEHTFHMLQPVNVTSKAND